MNTDLLKKVEMSQLQNHPQFEVGDEITVHNLIREGDKNRTQLFKGIVIAKKGSGLRASFTIRKISDGIGVEKIFPLHSPNVQKITINKHGKVRRSKIYYMRGRLGKAAMKIGNASETQLAKRSAQLEAGKAEVSQALGQVEAANEAVAPAKE